MHRFAVFVFVSLLLGPAVASAQGTAPARHSGPPATVAPRGVFIAPAPLGYGAPVVPWYYLPPPLPYSYYYEQALQQRMQRPPSSQSFEGSSPRCPRFFCDHTR